MRHQSLASHFCFIRRSNETKKGTLHENGTKLHIVKSNDATLVTTVTVKDDTTDREPSDYRQSFAL